MAVQLTFLLLVFASLLAFHECNRGIGININDDKIDRNVTADSKISLSPCSHTAFISGWCCITLHPPLCWDTKALCLANCPPN
uniref:Uncharacterized protein n=1 Tax=Hibiscus sabdariffa TaxID=183260 RepID=A0ABR2EWP4_9ROSI